MPKPTLIEVGQAGSTQKLMKMYNEWTPPVGKKVLSYQISPVVAGMHAPLVLTVMVRTVCPDDRYERRSGIPIGRPGW